MPRRSSAAVAPSLSSADILAKLSEGLKLQSKQSNLRAYIPHDKQYLFHISKTPVTLYIGGNRSGKTVGGAVETIYRLMGRHPYKEVAEAPIRARVHSVDFTYGCDQIIIPELRRWIPPSFLKNGNWEDSFSNQDRILTLVNKSTLEFKSYEQDVVKFAGTSRHFNWYDEEPPQHIYNESQARLVDTNGDTIITMTPLDGMTWVYDKLYLMGKEGQDKDINVIETQMDENPYLLASARERFLKGLDEDERNARRSGEFIAVGGKIFKQFSIAKHVIPAILSPKSAMLDWQWYVTVDHGYNNPTAILWHAVSPKNKIITFHEHYAREMTVDKHAEEYHRINKSFGKQPYITVGDPAMSQRSGITGTNILQEYAKNGVYISADQRADVASGLNKMIEYLKPNLKLNNEPTWQITENCVNMIKEMRAYRWDAFVSKKMAYDRNRKETPHKKDDHAIDSTRYMFTTMPDLTPEGEPVTIETYTGLGNNIGSDPTMDKLDLRLLRNGGIPMTAEQTAIATAQGYEPSDVIVTTGSDMYDPFY